MLLTLVWLWWILSYTRRVKCKWTGWLFLFAHRSLKHANRGADESCLTSSTVSRQNTFTARFLEWALKALNSKFPHLVYICADLSAFFSSFLKLSFKLHAVHVLCVLPLNAAHLSVLVHNWFSWLQSSPDSAKRFRLWFLCVSPEFKLLLSGPARQTVYENPNTTAANSTNYLQSKGGV